MEPKLMKATICRVPKDHKWESRVEFSDGPPQSAADTVGLGDDPSQEALEREIVIICKQHGVSNPPESGMIKVGGGHFDEPQATRPIHVVWIRHGDD